MIIKKTIHIATTKQFQLFPITKQVEQALAESGIKEGLVSLFVPHTTGGVRVNENKAQLHQDILKSFYNLVPLDTPYSHAANSHAHLKAFLIGSSENIPISGGKLQLGAHQNIFFIEFDGGRQRSIEVTLIGE